MDRLEHFYDLAQQLARCTWVIDDAARVEIGPPPEPLVISFFVQSLRDFVSNNGPERDQARDAREDAGGLAYAGDNSAQSYADLVAHLAIRRYVTLLAAARGNTAAAAFAAVWGGMPVERWSEKTREVLAARSTLGETILNLDAQEIASEWAIIAAKIRELEPFDMQQVEGHLAQEQRHVERLRSADPAAGDAAARQLPAPAAIIVSDHTPGALGRSMYSASQLAEKHGKSPNALRKRLDRWRNQVRKSGSGTWIEVGEISTRKRGISTVRRLSSRSSMHCLRSITSR